MMKEKQFVATVGIENQSARLGINEKGMHVQIENTDWPKSTRGPPRMAAINSFGYGGSNAHLLVREPRDTSEAVADRKFEDSALRVLVLSARSQPALVDTAKRFSHWLKTLPDDLQHQIDVSYTLSEHRTDHGVRMAVSAVSLSSASELLNMFAENSEVKNAGICSDKISKQCSKVGFVFGGQGSQWQGMAGDVLKHDKIRLIVNKIDKIAKKYGHKESLVAYLEENPDGEENGAENDCLVTVQLSIFALQYAIAEMLITDASISPIAVGGHSLGDITAACVSGIIKPKEAVKIILARASLQDKCQSKGAMAAIGEQHLIIINTVILDVLAVVIVLALSLQ